ncbi:MAG: glutaminyl-peptide cyclotransferase [Flavisolibacter sp.]
MKKICHLLSIALFLSFIGCNNNNDTGSADATTAKPVPALSYSVVSVQPHDTSFYTEGLEFYNGTLLESTGLKGKSRLVQTDPATGKILKKVDLDTNYFGEGITVLHDTLYQLTWQEHTVFVYTAKDFKKIKQLPLNPEGWGLTNDGKNLIASDGSSNIYFYEPQTFKLLRVQAVTENDAPAVNINELEYVNGYVYANQWQYNYILKIDPSNGHVVAKMDLTELVNKVKAADPQAEVLNGIAYNQATKKFYVTGKNWPQIYEIQFQF